DSVAAPQIERRQVIRRRLVIADSRQHARKRDLDWSFRPLLDAPLETVGIAHREARARAVKLGFHERVRRRLVERMPGAPRTVEEIRVRDIRRVDPKVDNSLLRYWRGHGRPDRHDEERDVRGREHESDQDRFLYARLFLSRIHADKTARSTPRQQILRGTTLAH